jgi:hypothetical protein
MIPYDIDPSLHTAEPEPQQLDDGFSPPHHGEPEPAVRPVPATGTDAALGEKSPF